MPTDLLDGIELEQHDFNKPLDAPKQVKGRVVHIDADFLAYQVSADNEKTLDEMKHNCSARIEKIRLMAGAQKAVLHLTPKESNKGGRYDAAMQKEYQGNRKDKPKPKMLHIMRDWMHQEYAAIQHMDCEADDGMSIAQYEAIAKGQRKLSVIATKDKDLTMVPGLSLDWDTHAITDTKDDFGYILLDEGNPKAKSPTKKIKGRGWKMFWAQMLTGDSADNVQGLPMVHTERFLRNGKPRACGAVTAYELLEPMTTNKAAFNLVRELYKDCGKGQGFVNYRDGSELSFGQVLQSEAQLLWMRRKVAITDALDWMRETCL